MPRQAQQPVSASVEPTLTETTAVASVQAVSTTDKASTPDAEPSTSSHWVRQQVDNNANANAPSIPSPTPVDSATTSSSQDIAPTDDTNAMGLFSQSQAVMETGGRTSSSSTQSIPVSRTGLIRPSFTSTYTRPGDQVTGIQPGIATASVFVLILTLALFLFLVRRWRRNRTRRRTRPVITFLNKSSSDHEKGMASVTLTEKPQGRAMPSDVESEFVANNAGVGAHVALALDELREPIAAKIRPRSIKGFKGSPSPTVQEGPSTLSAVKFVLPYAPARPSPLRVVS